MTLRVGVVVSVRVLTVSSFGVGRLSGSYFDWKPFANLSLTCSSSAE